MIDNEVGTSEPASESDPRTDDEMDSSAEGKMHRPRKKHVYEQILKQLEFYLGDANLSKDRYLSQVIRKNPEIPVDSFLSFNKIRNFTCDVKDLVTAIKKSTLLALTEDEAKVFRKTQIKRRENLDECTIYVENIPSDAHHEWLQRIFSIYGNVLYVSIPKFKNKTNKGFAFIEFDLPKCVTKALEAFGAAGCRLPANMPCDQLLSIRTFEDDGGKALYNPRKKMQDLTLPLTPYLPAMTEEKPAIVDEKSTAILGKRKRNISEEDSDGKKTREETDTADITSMGITLNAIKNTEMLELESNDEELDSDYDDEEKRNLLKIHNTKKAKNTHYLEVASLGLHILPKKEWKRLRNLYLNSQRQKLAQLKHKVNEAPSEVEEATDKPNSQTYAMVKGVVLKVMPEKHIEDINQFKTEVRGMSGVVYVDIVPDREEVYVRCESAEIASSLLAAKPWPNTSLLQAEQEQWYWQKIIEDRSAKLQTKKKVRCRKIKQHFKLPDQGQEIGGNNKKCTHIRFTDDTDDEVISNAASAPDDEPAKHILNAPTQSATEVSNSEAI